jgi:hypothetical protein
MLGIGMEGRATPGMDVSGAGRRMSVERASIPTPLFSIRFGAKFEGNG